MTVLEPLQDQEQVLTRRLSAQNKRAMSGGHFSSGHVANDNSRMHIGDAYHGDVSNTSNYTVFLSASDERSSRSQKRRRSESSDDERGTTSAKELMDSLYYEDLDYRKESLEGPQPQTFEWIFDGSGELFLPTQYMDGHVKWPSFPDWLESSDSSSLYCIVGKAGSGKSTLMPWISRDQVSLAQMGRHETCALSILPELQNSVTAQYGARNRHAGLSRWPVRKLKEMLRHVLQCSSQCVFCIFIDGVDELQDESDFKVDYDDLIEYLVALQRPEHIKLCLSSRPVVKKISRSPYATGTTLRLTDLNRTDISTYVHDTLSRCVELQDLNMLIIEVCTRADGVFLWAVFAVREITRWADTEGTSMLIQRLDKMGDEFEEVFAYMLSNIAHEHRGALAFYLKAMKWSNIGVIDGPPTVALLVASQEDITRKTYESLVERFDIEERRITQWSHGLLEVRPWIKSRGNGSRKWDKGSFVWAPRLQHHEVEPHTPLANPEGLQQEWMINMLDDYGQSVVAFGRRRVGWIHRSAYDFFFSPIGRQHAKYAEKLLELRDDNQITPALLQAYRRVGLMLPYSRRPDRYLEPGFTDLLYSFRLIVDPIIRTIGRAADILGECHNGILNEMLTILPTWQHRGAHSVVESWPLTFKDVLDDEEIRTRHSRNYAYTLRPCMENVCTVTLHLSVSARPTADSATESLFTRTDAHNPIADTLSEAYIWLTCAKKCLRYTIEHCISLLERRSGGLMLAYMLDALEHDPFYSSDSVIKFEPQLANHIQNWSKRFILAPTSFTIDEKGIFSDAYFCLSADTIISWSPRHTRKLMSIQGTDADENKFQYHEHDLYCEAEMVLALTRLYQRQLSRTSHPVLSKMMDAWNAWLDISPVTFKSLRLMVPMTAVRCIHTEAVKPFRLRLFSLVRRAEGSIGVAGHDVSDDLAQRCYRLCNSTEDSPRIGFGNFLNVVENLLQDVHRNRDRSNVDKEALKDALFTAAAAEAASLMRVKLLLLRWASTRFRSRHTRSLLSRLPTDSINLSRESMLAGIAEMKRLRGLALD